MNYEFSKMLSDIESEGSIVNIFNWIDENMDGAHTKATDEFYAKLDKGLSFPEVKQAQLIYADKVKEMIAFYKKEKARSELS